MKETVMQGKPYAGNPHVRFDEGEVASVVTPRRGSLLYNMRKQTWKAAVSAAAIAATATIPMAANADTDGTVTINGVTWTYTNRNDTDKTVTLGASGSMSTSTWKTAMPKNTSIDAANIPWFMVIDGETYTVTRVGQYAFAGCRSMTGTLAIPATVTGIDTRAFWAVSGLNMVSTLGGTTALGSYAFYFSSSEGILKGGFPDLSKVTTLGTGPFLNCTTLDGEVVLNPELTSIPTRCFENTALSRVAIPRSVTSISEKAFMKTKLTAFVLPGPSDSQSHVTINTANAFNGCDGLKVALFGRNAWGNTLSAGTMLKDVSGCAVFVPANGHWNNLVTGGDNNQVIYYGQGQELDIEMDDVSKTITATPTTVHTLTNVLNAASPLKRGASWNTKISVTNAIDLAGLTITETMTQAVTFDKLVFSAKTQSQLNNLLDTFPATTPISIDPTGLTENMVIPDTYPNVFVKAVPGVIIRRTANGFIITVK